MATESPARPTGWKLTIRHSIGVLECGSGGGDRLAATLPMRHIMILEILNESLLHDASVPSPLQGFRSLGEIAAAYAKRNGGYEPDLDVISVYLAQIRAGLRAAAATGQTVPVLFISKRCVGVRLAAPISIIYLAKEER